MYRREGEPPRDGAIWETRTGTVFAARLAASTERSRPGAQRVAGPSPVPEPPLVWCRLSTSTGTRVPRAPGPELRRWSRAGCRRCPRRFRVTGRTAGQRDPGGAVEVRRREQLTQLRRYHLEAGGARGLPDVPGEVDLQPPRQLGAVVGGEQVRDTALAGLTVDADDHVVRSEAGLGEQAGEVAVGLRRRRVADLDIVVARLDEQLEEVALAGRVHRLGRAWYRRAGRPAPTAAPASACGRASCRRRGRAPACSTSPRAGTWCSAAPSSSR